MPLSRTSREPRQPLRAVPFRFRLRIFRADKSERDGAPAPVVPLEHRALVDSAVFAATGHSLPKIGDILAANSRTKTHLI